MTNFHYVGVDGGWSWEWEHRGLTYQVVNFDRSSMVHVYSAPTDDPGEWKFLFTRGIGTNAQSAAERICAEVIGGESD